MNEDRKQMVFLILSVVRWATLVFSFLSISVPNSSADDT